MSRLRVGVMGFGRLGMLHAVNLERYAGAELVAVYDVDRKARVRARGFGVPAISHLEVFFSIPMEAVVIASDTPSHADNIQAAARAGKAIFTEKPVGLDMGETDAALQEVVDAGVPFQIDFQRRWDPRYRRVRELLESGHIGDPILLKAHGRDPRSSTSAGGIFRNCAIHDYDATRWLLGTEIQAVSATGGSLVHAELDTCSTTMFLDGAMAMTEWSRYATYGYDVALEIVCTRGVVRFGSQRTEKDLFVHIPGEGSATVFTVFREAFQASIEGFVDAVAAGKDTSPGVEDARVSLQVALAAQSSFRAGSARVKVPPLSPLARYSDVG